MLDLNHQGYQKTEIPKGINSLCLSYWAFYLTSKWTALLFNHAEFQIWNSIQNIVKWSTSVQDPSDPASVPSYFIYLCDRSRQPTHNEVVDPHTQYNTMDNTSFCLLSEPCTSSQGTIQQCLLIHPCYIIPPQADRCYTPWPDDLCSWLSSDLCAGNCTWLWMINKPGWHNGRVHIIKEKA